MSDPLSQMLAWCVTTLGIAFYLIAAFSALCYIALPIYLMWRLGHNAKAADARHQETIRFLRLVATECRDVRRAIHDRDE